MPEITPGTKLFIATPCYGRQVYAPYVNSLLDTVNTLNKLEVPMITCFVDGASINHSRNTLVCKFMTSPCTHMLFIDADIEWHAEDVSRLLGATCLADIEIACGIYPQKRLPLTYPVRFLRSEDGTVRLHPVAGFWAARDVPAGFLMIRRNAIEQLCYAYPEHKCTWRDPRGGEQHGYALFDCTINEEGRYTGEDYGFTLLWRQQGGVIWVDPQCRLTHHGMYEYKSDPAEAMEQHSLRLERQLT